MQSRRLTEVRDTLRSQEFQTWWEELQAAQAARAEAREKYDELLTQAMLMDFRAELAQKNAIDTLYRAGEFEDQASTMMAEAQDLENSSFKVVAEYEEHRYHVSELWYRLGATEKSLEEGKDEVTALKARLTAATGPMVREVEAELKRAEAEFIQLQRTHRSAGDEYEREHARQKKLWTEVEKLWARSAEMSLLIAERRSQAKKIRKHSEELFQTTEDRKAKARQLREEAESESRAKESGELRIAEHLKQAQERFGCGAGDEFLYWRQRDNHRGAWCVPLFDDAFSYNIEVKALSVYSADRQRGVSFLEPAIEAPPSVQDGDRRFEEYFLKGRKGAVPLSPPGTSS
jgi:hypothetical protein